MNKKNLLRLTFGLALVSMCFSVNVLAMNSSMPTDTEMQKLEEVLASTSNKPDGGKAVAMNEELTEKLKKGKLLDAEYEKEIAAILNLYMEEVSAAYEGMGHLPPKDKGRKGETDSTGQGTGLLGEMYDRVVKLQKQVRGMTFETPIGKEASRKWLAFWRGSILSPTPVSKKKKD